MSFDPILYIFSGPSGAGKGSVMRALLADDHSLHKVVTYTSRPPREGEIDGFDYHFVSNAEFEQKIAEGTVFEYERVYRDYYYGSPRDLFIPDHDGIIELDYKGRLKYRERFPQSVSIFLLPPDLDTLKDRILGRSQVSNLQARLDNALEQIRHADAFDYVVKNGDLDVCVHEIKTIMAAERIRRRGRADWSAFIREIGLDTP